MWLPQGLRAHCGPSSRVSAARLSLWLPPQAIHTPQGPAPASGGLGQCFGHGHLTERAAVAEGSGLSPHLCTDHQPL